MIPTVIVAGLILGRWWRFALAAATLGWPLALLISDASGLTVVDLLLAAVLAFANAAVGVAVHQALLWGFRRVRRLLTGGRPRPAGERSP